LRPISDALQIVDIFRAWRVLASERARIMIRRYESPGWRVTPSAPTASGLLLDISRGATPDRKAAA